MIIWINGAFGSGKTAAAEELHRRIPDSFVYDPENLGFFIRRNSPGIYSEGDFQNIPFWRSGNYSLLLTQLTGAVKLLMRISQKRKFTLIISLSAKQPKRLRKNAELSCFPTIWGDWAGLHNG